MEALARLTVIARNTLLESFRQRVLNVLILFGLVVIMAAKYFSQFEFSVDQEFKFVKDFCLGAMAVVGVLLAILSVAQLLPQELESRTIFTILSKPVRRWEFLLGKYCGVALLLAIVLALSSAVFAGMLWVTEQSQLSRLEEQYAEVVAAKPEEKARMIEEQRQIAAQIRTEAHDTRLIQAVVVLYAKLLIVAALGLLISTFSTSMIFTVVMTSMIYIAGHLIAPAKSAWLMPGSTDVGKAAFLGAISYLVPDFSAFNLIDAIVEGSEVTWAVTGRLLTYAGTYLAVVLLASCAIFSSREL